MLAGDPLLAPGAHSGPGHSHDDDDDDIDTDDTDDTDDHNDDTDNDDIDDQVTDLSLIIRLLKGPDPDTNVTDSGIHDFFSKKFSQFDAR